MSFHEVMVEGTLKPDGTLELDQKPNLSPGRVTVLLRQEEMVEPLKGDWFQFMLNARRKMQEAGCRFMDEKEVQAHVDWFREGDRIDDQRTPNDSSIHNKDYLMHHRTRKNSACP